MGKHCLHHAGTVPVTPAFLARKKINRRTIMQATAAFAAMATVSGASRPRASAQGTPTVAGEWIQPDNIGSSDGSLGFQTDFPFYAIAPHWPGETEFAAAVEVQLSNDGEAWSDPTILGPAHTDAGPPDRDNRVFGQLAFTQESRFVRYRPLDVDGNMRSLPGLSFTYIDATGGPGLDDISTSSPVPSLDRPPIISREEWGAGLAYGGVEAGARDWLPEFRTVEHVIIHHSETTNFRNPLAEIRSIHYYHAITRGWGDIGYNYLVDFMGNVYEGRSGGDNVVGGHAYQYAYGSSGICTIGSFSMEAATPEALAGLIWISAWAGRYLDPLGRADFHEQTNLPTICGHRDVNDSTCPGDGLYADLGYIREAVAEVLAGAWETIPDPAFSPGEVVETTAEGVNLRESPGTDTGIVSEVPLAAVFQVIEGPTTVDDHVWYHVDGDAGSGWLATSTFGPSNAAPPVGKFEIGEEIVIDTDMLNIRDEPSLKGLIVATLPYMAPATVLEGPMPANGYKWYRVETADGAGWSAEQYLNREEDVEPPTRFLVGEGVMVSEAEGIRLRTSPTRDSSSVASLSPGVTGSVVEGPEAADGYVWLKIKTEQGTGWTADEFLASAPNPEPSTARFKVGDDVIVDTDALNLRETAGADQPIITTLGTGVGAEIVDGPKPANNLNWYKLESDYGVGWSVESFLTVAGTSNASSAFEQGARVHVTTDALNLRTSPGTESDVVTVLFTNASATVLDGPEEQDGYVWYQVESDEGTGWSAAQYLGDGTADPATGNRLSAGDQVIMNTDALNIRDQPSIDAAWVAGLYPGETATVVDGPVEADGHSWMKIAAPFGEGWSVRSFMERTGDAGVKAGDTARVFDGELNLREAASLGSEVIAILPDAARVEVLEGPVGGDDHNWFRVSSSRHGTGWCVGDWLARA